ncbi:phenylalanine--tRNA ligase subunit beta [[Mycoplasma] collis]|uniref:phenylalanine--tRNA ligase subunit beta n=1 Tax=[Mycoplasma] collis TaxID=2127 RepID=UPI00051BE89F|nr:phenylalanine--tRNA ligase subunit beta [[Mycoplasma] collis]
MIFSFKRLMKMTNLANNIKIDDVVKAINSIGFEVENYWKFNHIENMKFGHIIKTYKNPNADKLTVCEIEFNDKNRIIQTNATNVKVDDYVMAFVPGSKNNEIVFGEKKLKGIISEGMLVSLNELGFDPNLVWDEFKDGIFTFKKVDLTLDPLEFFELNDYLIDVTILSNRSDANSYYIMAKELCAFFNNEFQEIPFKKPHFKSDFIIENNLGYLSGMESKVDSNFNLSIQDSFLILKSNIKLISSYVDLSNLIYLLSGMPNHGYDKEKIKAPIKAKIFSKNIKVLGDKNIDFNDAIGIIDGNNNVVSIAGIIGSEGYGINENSKNIIFEVGKFPIGEIRKTQRQLKLDTNAYKQSSKNISIGTMELAFKFLSNYLPNFSEVINFPKVEKKVIDFDRNKIKQIVGFDIFSDSKFDKVKNSLEILDFVFDKGKILIPNYRNDIENINDIIEEILRFYGYSSIKAEQPIIQSSIVNEINFLENEIMANGFQEVRTYTLTSKEKNIFNPFKFTKNFTLKTFISKEREQVRNSLAISLAEIINYNNKRKINDISIFEIGMISDLKNILAFASTNKTFNELKQIVLNLFGNHLIFKRTNEIIFNNNVSAYIYFENEIIGWIGKISPFVINVDAFFVEINLDKISYEKNLEYKSYDSNPLKTRDITFSLKEKESINEKIDYLYANFENIYKVKIIDIFIKNNERKITINVVCDEDTSKKIDDFYN